MNHGETPAFSTRRSFLQTTAAGAASLLAAGQSWSAETPGSDKAQIAITLDLEMARNFPEWTDTHWDYEKGNLNDPAKRYAVEACRRVKARGGRIHTFVVGQVFEQENVEWLQEIAAEGHPIGNHTYDHVYMLARDPSEVQYRFRRAPWLLGKRTVPEVLRDNVALTSAALKDRLGVEVSGFRTPGGHATGLHDREDVQTMLLDLGFEWISCVYPSHHIADVHELGQTPAEETLASIMAAQRTAQPLQYPTGLIDLPMSPISDIGAFRNGRWKLDAFQHAIRMAVEMAIERRMVFDFLAHPSCLGVVDPEFKTIDMICDLVDGSDGAAELVTLDVVAERFKAQLAAA